jgi:hypothetical protein
MAGPRIKNRTFIRAKTRIKSILEPRLIFVCFRTLSRSIFSCVLSLVNHEGTFSLPKDHQCLLPSSNCHNWWHAASLAFKSRQEQILIYHRFGFDISSISAINGTDQYIDYFNNPQGIVQGGIGAGLAGGSVIGAIIAGPVLNKIGRRDAIFFACLW